MVIPQSVWCPKWERMGWPRELWHRKILCQNLHHGSKLDVRIPTFVTKFNVRTPQGQYYLIRPCLNSACVKHLLAESPGLPPLPHGITLTGALKYIFIESVCKLLKIQYCKYNRYNDHAFSIWKWATICYFLTASKCQQGSLV